MYGCWTVLIKSLNNCYWKKENKYSCILVVFEINHGFEILMVNKYLYITVAEKSIVSRAGVAERFTAPCVRHRWSWVRTPKPPPMLADTSAGTFIKKARLPCWPLYSQQVSHQRWIWGICCVQVRKQASEGSTLALKARADVTRR